MPTHPSGDSPDAAGLTSLFEKVQDLLIREKHRDAHQVAQEIVRRAPEDASGSMLLLATASACGDEATIEDALLVLSDHYEKLVATPEFLAFIESDLLAPAVSSRMFCEVFAPSLRAVQRRLSDANFVRSDMDRQVHDALDAAALENAFRKAPAFRAPAAEPEMGPLELVDCETGAAAVLLPGRGYIGGRSSDADIGLAHPSVSRMHFNITQENDRWILRNLSRTNGTRVNGENIGEGWACLRDGDEIQIGAVRLEVSFATQGAYFRPDGSAVKLTPDRSTDQGARRTAIHAPPPEPGTDPLSIVVRPRPPLNSLDGEPRRKTAPHPICDHKDAKSGG